MLTVMLFTPALIFTSSKCSDYRWVTTRFLIKTKKSVLKSWVYLKFTDILDSTTEEFKATLKVSKVRFGSFEKRVSSRFFLLASIMTLSAIALKFWASIWSPSINLKISRISCFDIVPLFDISKSLKTKRILDMAELGILSGVFSRVGWKCAKILQKWWKEHFPSSPGTNIPMILKFFI